MQNLLTKRERDLISESLNFIQRNGNEKTLRSHKRKVLERTDYNQSLFPEGTAADLLRKLVSIPSFSGNFRSDFLETFLQKRMPTQRIVNNLIVRQPHHDEKSYPHAPIRISILYVRQRVTLSTRLSLPFPTPGYSVGQQRCGRFRGIDDRNFSSFLQYRAAVQPHAGAFVRREFRSRRYAENVAGNKGYGRFCHCGEPTEMKAAIAERGLLVIDAEAKGVSGMRHSTRCECHLHCRGRYPHAAHDNTRQNIADDG